MKSVRRESRGDNCLEVSAEEGVRPIGERLGALLAVLIASMVAVPVLVAGIAGALLGPGRETTASMLAVLFQQVAMFAITFHRLRAHGVGWADLRPDVGGLAQGARGVGWGVALLFFNAFSVQLSVALFGAVLGPGWVEEVMAREQAVVGRLLDPEVGRFHLQWIVFMAVGVAPVVEELVFRGYAYPALKAHTGRHAMWLSALLFASVHMYLINFLPLFLLGILLAWLYERYRTISVPILAHATMNGFVAVIAVLGNRVG